MFSSSLKGFSEGRLKLLLLVFFLSLLLPTLVLIYNAYGQLKWEAFHQHRLMAEELANRIDARINSMIAVEEARSTADYNFLVLAGDPGSGLLQRSPLSNYPVDSVVPGLLGYFQVDSLGRFTTPLLPPPDSRSDAYGVGEQEYRRRLSLEQQVKEVLSKNQLVQTSQKGDMPELARETFADDESKTQRAFDQLAEAESPRQQSKKLRQSSGALGRLEDIDLDSSFASQRPNQNSVRQPAPASSRAGLKKREKRKEQISLPEPLSRSDLRIATFESEIDPFYFRQLDSGQFVLFRKVWREGERTIQGALIDQRAFVDDVIGSAFRDTVLSRMSQLIVAYQGNVLNVFYDPTDNDDSDYLASTRELSGELLYQTGLSAPLGKLELIFSITDLPAGPSAGVLSRVAIILLIVLCGGCYLMYRLGLGQIRLARQQQDFVSAVSHELKTPLTSIQMYGEILQAGWADEEKKQGYYDYIYEESQRLSRLINNVLQLARMTRNEFKPELRPVTVGELMDVIESKIASQVQRAGFALVLQTDPRLDQCLVLVDTDGVTQIFINLLDNAIKFSSRADSKQIEFGCQPGSEGTVRFTVRDFGPGIPKGQMKKIFKLFYRLENELTRETVGTGIGLALVQQLALAMNGKVDVCNRRPGAEFSLSLKIMKIPATGSSLT
jgi:signal transduction histidine kinase